MATPKNLFKTIKNITTPGFGDGWYGESDCSKQYQTINPTMNFKYDNQRGIILAAGKKLKHKIDFKSLFIPLRMPIGDLPWDGGIYEDLSGEKP